MTTPTQSVYIKRTRRPRRTLEELSQAKKDYEAQCIAAGVKYGMCFCGCEGNTPIASNLKGIPTRFLMGHRSGMDHAVLRKALHDEEVPYGYCHCLCGEKAPIAVGTSSRIGHVKGQPVRYIFGHQHKIKGVSKKFIKFQGKNVKGPKYVEVQLETYVTPCWEWQWSRSPEGYGVAVVNGGHTNAHRVSYIDYYGPISKKTVVHHKCENPPCVNPDHLMAMSNADNIRLSRRTSLTEEMVFRMFELREGGMKWRDIAVDVGISYESARAIGCGKRWGDVKDKYLRVKHLIN